MGWSREKAIEHYRTTVGWDQPERASGVIDGVAFEPGQYLVYFVGQQKIAALRAQAEKELGPRFDLRGFHDEILRNGPLPFDVLDAQVADARAKAMSEKRPLLLDFTATWCGACKELDKHTFSEPDVAAEAGRFVAIKVDATNSDDPKVESTMEQHQVVGLPTVLVYDSRGAEAVRCTDFVTPERFLAAIKSVN